MLNNKHIHNNFSSFYTTGTTGESLRSIPTIIRHYYKVILLGTISVGKSSIISQFVYENFANEYSCTINASYYTKSITIDDNIFVDINIWDTCGQEKYKSITRQYYKDAKGRYIDYINIGCILVFDVTNRDSFNQIEKLIEDVLDFGDEETAIIIVGNKSDLVESYKVNKFKYSSIVTFEQASELAKSYNVDYIEVSAKTGMNINFLFEFLCKAMMKKSEESELNKINDKITNSGKILLDKSVYYNKSSKIKHKTINRYNSNSNNYSDTDNDKANDKSNTQGKCC